jgi:hypothetical protein
MPTSPSSSAPARARSPAAWLRPARVSSRSSGIPNSPASFATASAGTETCAWSRPTHGPFPCRPGGSPLSPAFPTSYRRRCSGACSPRRTPRLRQAAITVEWGFAKRVAAAVPRNLEQAWCATRFDIRLASRIPASCFSPPPRVVSAPLVLGRREVHGERALWTLLEAAYRAPSVPARALVHHNPHRALRGAGIDPAQPTGTVPPHRWAALAGQLAADRSRYWPPLPRRLR